MRQRENTAVCVVMPAYNSGATIRHTIEGVLQHGLPLIVVDDGSHDGSELLLAARHDITLVRLPSNRGKGIAIRNGFAVAREHGFTHAITIDSDGQHDPADVPRFAQAVIRHPHAIIVGVRDLKGTGARLKSRLLRTNSNFWTWVETGTWTADSQSGYRAYPLRLIDTIHLCTHRYDFEIEVLVKSLWCGAGISELPIDVHYDTGCPSKFRPLADFALVSRLNNRLVAMRLFIPLTIRRMLVRRAFHRRTWRQRWRWLLQRFLLGNTDQPMRAGLAVGLGVCCGILPIWGFQMVAAFASARRWRLNPLLTVLASNISFGGMAVVIVLLSIWFGHLILHGQSSGLWELPSQWRSVGQHLIEYLVGSVALAGAAGLATGIAAWAIFSLVTRARSRD